MFFSGTGIRPRGQARGRASPGDALIARGHVDVGYFQLDPGWLKLYGSICHDACQYRVAGCAHDE